MFVLGSEIKISGKDPDTGKAYAYTFRSVNDIEIENDGRQIGDFATIKLPLSARIEKAGEYSTAVQTARTFHAGDEIIMKFGYDGNLREEFHGFIRKIRPNIPLEIECEDAIYLLKRKPLQKAWKSVTLKDMLQFIIADTGITLDGEPPEINFTNFYIKNISAAKTLQKLKNEYGLRIYFKSFKKLYVGISSDNNDKAIKYRFGENVIDSDLEWTNESDVKLRIKAVNILPDNSQVVEHAGEVGGDQRTIFFYDIENPKELKQMAGEEVKKYTYSGYKGSYKTFLLPVAEVGDVANILDPNFPERSGKYLIEKTKVSFGQGGGRRMIYPGLKVS